MLYAEALGDNRKEPHLEPIGLSIKDAGIALGGTHRPLSRASIYRMLGKQQLQAVKVGARTLVTTDSLKAHMAAAPRFGAAA